MKLLVDLVVPKPSMLDVSELLRPENEGSKEKEQFREYHDDSNPRTQIIRDTYYQMHTKQTVDFVKQQHDKWLRFDHLESAVMPVLEKLNDLVDESDPDSDMPNIVHAFQTAEKIREVYPEEDWFHLTGLIHDMGKVLAFYGEPQWAVVGDTFPVGCAFQNSIVFSDWSFKDNPDLYHELYSLPNGMYKEKCGIRNLTMSWGHDEYLYQVLVHNKAKLPQEALDIIRYHSFYPWHSGGDYKNFMDDSDVDTMKWVQKFNEFDLYTKSSNVPDIEKLKPYYQGLIDKYIPGTIKF